MPFYYSAANHERIGPYSMEELIRLYHAGVIQLETEISTADSKETVPFALLWNRWRHSLQIGQPPSPPLPETEPEAPRSFTKQASRDIRDMLPHLVRLTTLPFLHAIWTGMAGYFLGFAFQYPERRGGLLVVAIGLPAFLHGTYNAFSATLGLPVALLSVLALNLYLAKSVDFGNLLNERKPTNPDHS